ncbi:fluoride efflux transporter FluC [Cellulomonas chengniuliangii]|uniref:Fluoride-specific ion channel FluC n=1 Tax=Cellulomonas chengniuliangii TaxID=2968084 RepID=A0ABY5KXI5_9CELL|nr:CrcB family protein [Cellulomonas chengniuliangii]MCC2310041.1 CrcB family protein [Cellulomonas chengniuliangii]UUI74563.1 CrcB family protein [Cellulomonas chengniuliangii]
MSRSLAYLLVGVGGAVGGLLRWGATTVVDEAAGAFPWTTFTVNMVGAFALGLLVVGIVGRRQAPPWVRTALGTGLLGGFTTFSAYAHAVDVLATGGEVGTAMAYLVSSVLVGVAAAGAGAAVGARLPARRRRAGDSPTTAHGWSK